MERLDATNETSVAEQKTNKTLWIASSALFALLAILALAVTASAATTHTVCPDGSCAFSSIQAAIDGASAGDTIEVGAGEYQERLQITKPLSLLGATGDPADVVVDGNGAIYAVEIGTPSTPTSDVTLKALTIQNPSFAATGNVDPSLVVTWGSDDLLLENLVLSQPASALESGETRKAALGINIGTAPTDDSADDVTIRDVLIQDLPEPSGPLATCSNCETIGIHDWSHGTGLTVEDVTIRGSKTLGVLAKTTGTVTITHTEVHIDEALADRDGIRVVGGSDHVITQNDVHGNLYPGSIGIDVDGATAPTVTLNGVTGTDTTIHAGEAIDGSGVGIRVIDSSDAAIRGNEIRSLPNNQFAAQTLGISLVLGDGHDLQSNKYRGTGVGLSVISSTDTELRNEFWDATETAIELRASGSDQPTPLKARYGDATGVNTIIELGSGTDGVFADLRLNNWAVYEPELIEARVDDQGTDNTVELVPFLDADGEIEPGLPRVLGPASHSSNQASCDAHPDAEFKSGECRFLSVQAAIDFSHPGGTVLLPGSADAVEPTPYLETVTIDLNNDAPAETLTGLELCGSVVVLECAAVDEPARWGIFSDASWGSPPVEHQGQAIRMDSARGDSTSLFTRDIATGEGAPQVADLHGLGFDLLVESGDCAPNNPRMTLRVDTTGDGTADTDRQVYTASSFTCPVPGEWVHVDLLESDNWGSLSATPSTQADAHTALGPDHRILSMNLIVDSGNGDILWIDNQRYQDSFLREPGDQCSGEDVTTCRADAEQRATDRVVMDGTGIGDTVIQAAAEDVTVSGINVVWSGDEGDQLATGDNTLRGIHAARDGVTIQENLVQLGNVDPFDFAFAVDISGRDDVRIMDNTIQAVVEGTTVPAAETNSGIMASGADTATIAANTINGWISHGIFLTSSEGSEISANTFVENQRGFSACTVEDLRVEANLFAGNLQAGWFCGPATDGPDADDAGAVLRENIFRGDADVAPIVLNSDTDNSLIDARLNDWAVYDHRLLPERVNDAGSGNEVLQVPFIDADGLAEPPLIRVNHADGSPLSTFLGIQDAIDDAATGTGDHIIVPGSTLTDDVRKPARTPYFESVTVDKQGVSLCGVPVGASEFNFCWPDFEPGEHATIDASGQGGPTITVTADDVRVSGLHLAGSNPLVQAADADSFELSHNRIELGLSEASSHTAVDLDRATETVVQDNLIQLSVLNAAGAGGTARGLDASQSQALTITGNTLLGDTNHPATTAIQLAPGGVGSDGGSGHLLEDNRIIDATNGIRLVAAADASIRSNLVLVSASSTLSGGASLALVDGSGHALEGNLLAGADTGLLVDGATGVTSELDVFEADLVGIRLDDLAGSPVPGAVDFEVHNATLARTGTALVLGTNTQALFVDAECNDWGVYNAQAISERIDDQGAPGNEVDFEPYTGAEGASLECLEVPDVSFTVDDPNGAPATRLDELVFTDTSQEGSHAMVERTWDFGDGRTVTESVITEDATISHSYGSINTFVATLEVRDAEGMSSRAAKLITIENTPPTIEVDGTLTGHHTDTLHAFVRATDVDDENPWLAVTDLPLNAVFDRSGPSTGVVTFEPDASQAGSHAVNLLADDGQPSDNTAEETFQFLVGNDGPIFDPPLPETLEAIAGAEVTLDLRAVDPDGDDITGLSADTSNLANPGDASLVSAGGEGTFSWTPPADATGSFSVAFTATSPAASITEIVEFVVAHNGAPVIDPIGDIAVGEGGHLSIPISATDPNGETPSFIAGGSMLRAGAGIHLPLDEAAGSTMFTDIRGGNDGTCTSPACPTAGIQGAEETAISLDGSDDLVDLGTPSLTNVERDDAYTIEFWVNTSASGSGALVAKMEQAPVFRGYDVFIHDGKIRAHVIHDWASDNAIAEDSTTLVNDGAWHHVAVSYDGSSSSDGLEIYLDGELETTTVVKDALTGSIQNTVPFQLGARDGAQQIAASLDEVAFYTRALTGDEIQALSEPPVQTTGLPDNAVFQDNRNGRAAFIFDPSYEQAGDYLITVTATDGVNTATEMFTVTVIDRDPSEVNGTPVVSGPDIVEAVEGAQVRAWFNATDPEDDPLELTAQHLPEGAVFEEMGPGMSRITWTPGFDQAGIYRSAIRASDPGGYTLHQFLFDVEDVPHDPEITVVGATTLFELETLKLAVSAEDPDDDPVTLDVQGLPDGASFDATTGEISWTPSLTQAGVYELTVVARAGEETSTQTVEVTVAEDTLSVELRLLGDGRYGSLEEVIILVDVVTENGGVAIPGMSLQAEVFHDATPAELFLGETGATTIANGQAALVIDEDVLETANLVGSHRVDVTGEVPAELGDMAPMDASISYIVTVP